MPPAIKVSRKDILGIHSEPKDLNKIYGVKKKKDLWGVGLNLLGSMLVFICYAPPAISVVPHIPSGTVSVSETSALKLCLGYRAFMPLTVNTSKISRAHPSFSLVPALPGGESKLPSLLLS